MQASIRSNLWSRGGIIYVISRSQNVFTNEPGSIQLTTIDAETHRLMDRDFIVRYFDTNPEKGCGTKETGPSLDPTCPAYTFGIQNADP